MREVFKPNLICSLALAGGMSLLAAPASNAAPIDKGQRPNIVLIVADDMGYSDLSAFGSEIKTPNLDAIANQGVILSNYHTAPTCSPTRSMLMSGTDNHIAGVGTMAELVLPEQKGKRGYEGYLTDRVVAFPKLLQANGYRTMMVGKWHLGRTPELSPVARGFDQSFALIEGSADHFTQGGTTDKNPKATYRLNGQEIELPKDFGYSSDYFTSTAIKQIGSGNSGKPFFAYLAYTAPHWPLQVPAAYQERYRGFYDKGYASIAQARLERMKAKGLIAGDVQINPGPDVWPGWEKLSTKEQQLEARRMEIYAGMITNLDDNIGRLVKHLKDTGQYDNTVFVFFSDNGAEGSNPEDVTPNNGKWIAEHFDNSLNNIGKPGSFSGYGPNWARVSSTPFRMYKAFTYEGGIRTAAFIKGPGMRHGEISDTYMSVKDIAPTFLELAQINHPSTEDASVTKMQGSSALGFLKKNQASVHPADEVQCTELFGRVSLLQGNWKMTFSNAPWGTGQWELFDIRKDPTELHNLAAQQPQVTRSLLNQWQQCQARNGIEWDTELATKIRFGNEIKHYETADEQSR
ncbi:arylsulfatase [Pseudomonas sp. Root562]|uniref:arylsulfatase n=1 Tax=Pseudomonas sp. Root562 TaxID=1736561 RepID=UPI000702B807|nr:arylsulfatase [Pseudomonas sp. Root562]KQZ78585.1 arylsulfatase [Pseudomonas sp. Root562]